MFPPHQGLSPMRWAPCKEVVLWRLYTQKWLVPSVRVFVQVREMRDFRVFQESVLVRMSPDPSGGLADLKSVISSVLQFFPGGSYEAVNGKVSWEVD